MPWVFNGWVSRLENAVSSNRTSACRFLARLSMSCSAFQPVDPPSRSVCGEVPARDIGARHRKTDQAKNQAGRFKRRLRLLSPKIIKVEPVVGRQAAVAFQAVGVALGPLLNLRVSMLSVDRHLVGEQLEMHFVAIASAIQPEKQHHRRLYDARNPH